MRFGLLLLLSLISQSGAADQPVIQSVARPAQFFTEIIGPRRSTDLAPLPLMIQVR